MDALLRNENFNFYVDEISYREDNKFDVRSIPDINSRYFPPFHLRNFNVTGELLTQTFYNSIIQKQGKDVSATLSDQGIRKFRGSVVQGAYYQMPTQRLLNYINQDGKIDYSYLFSEQSDIFRESLRESPNSETLIAGNVNLSLLNGFDYLSSDNTDILDGTYLYCFNVGQGDSLLLITANGSVYLIDTNFYSDAHISVITNIIKNRLSLHGLPINRIKGLIITHKHLDHIRGAKNFIESGNFTIDTFMINQDYVHSTNCVIDLFNAARTHIPNWINVNGRGRITEGKTVICFNNPDTDTSSNVDVEDINDSSICLCIGHKGSCLYLTGDAGYNIINNKYMVLHNFITKGMLKVSHHGSRDGTDDVTLNILTPSHAFISAGTSRRYHHPHQETITRLDSYRPDIVRTVSKEIKKTVVYRMSNSGIDMSCF